MPSKTGGGRTVMPVVAVAVRWSTESVAVNITEADTGPVGVKENVPVTGLLPKVVNVAPAGSPVAVKVSVFISASSAVAMKVVRTPIEVITELGAEIRRKSGGEGALGWNVSTFGVAPPLVMVTHKPVTLVPIQRPDTASMVVNPVETTL